MSRNTIKRFPAPPVQAVRIQLDELYQPACPHCACQVFGTGHELYVLPKLRSPKGKAEFIRKEVFFCVRCHEPLDAQKAMAAGDSTIVLPG